MEEIKDKKQDFRNQMAERLGALSEKVFLEKQQIVVDKLFDFANFIEAKIALLYLNGHWEIDTRLILQRALDMGKIIVLPVRAREKPRVMLYKIDAPARDIITDSEGQPVPDTSRCKKVPIDCIDIAVIPGLAFDEKGGRIGLGDGYYDYLIPKLPATARKVAVALEDQMVPAVPMESHDKYVDIIITDTRVIYKI